MSRSTQDKVLKTIEAAATDYGFEVITDFAYGNIGNLTIQPTDGFESVLRLGFRFNSESFHLYDIKPQLPEIGRIDSRNNSQSIDVWGEKLVGSSNTADEVIKAIRNHLAGIKQAQLAKEGIV